jgi:hypothetical protein
MRFSCLGSPQNNERTRDAARLMLVTAHPRQEHFYTCGVIPQVYHCLQNQYFSRIKAGSWLRKQLIQKILSDSIRIFLNPGLDAKAANPTSPCQLYFVPRVAWRNGPSSR